jgi:hypothetical protein
MDKTFLTVNTTTGAFSSGGRPVEGVSGVYGDNLLFAVEFKENIPGSVSSALALTGATALRCIIRSDRQPTSSELWSFQSTYNNGDYAAFEDLPNGKATWVVSLSTIAYAITAVDTGTDKLTIAGDLTNQFDDGDTFTITGSTGNDGTYTVATSGVVLSGSNTVIEVDEDITDATVDGSINHSALDNTLADSTNDYVDGWLEFSWLDASANPQTLAQMKIRVYRQIDDGAVGTPVPTSPSYYTASEVLDLAMIHVQVESIDATAIAQTTVYTVPANKKMRVISGDDETTAITTAGTAPTVQWGTTASPALFAAPFLSDSNAVNEVNENEFGNEDMLPAATVIEYGITVASTAAAHTQTAILKGYLLDA